MRSISSQDISDSQHSHQDFCKQPYLYPSSNPGHDSRHAPSSQGQPHHAFRRSFASNDYSYDLQSNRVRFKPQATDKSSSRSSSLNEKQGYREFISRQPKPEINSHNQFRIESNQKKKLKTSISPLIKSQVGATDIYTPSKIKHMPELVPEPVSEYLEDPSDS